MQVAENKSLGRFGDRRLDKGGRRFSMPCFARAVFACAQSDTLSPPRRPKWDIEN